MYIDSLSTHRLEKQKSEDEKNMIEKNKQIEELTNKYVALQKLCESFHSDSKVKDEIQLLKKNKEALEVCCSFVLFETSGG